MNRRVSLALPALTVVMIFAGCIEREGIPVSPCTNVTIAEEINIENVDKVDLLFMVDNSFSMSQEQASLIAEFPRLVNILASGDFDQDGDGAGDGEIDDPDFEPVRSLNIGVVTSDMGSGGHTVMSCGRSDFGDDGVLQTLGRTDLPGCQPSYPTFLGFEPASGALPSDFARDVSCVATTGTDGCGYEQQLEAILKALSPSAATTWTAPGYTAPTFFRNTFGHADTNNAGFIREDSVLAIIPVTDEEDCSARDPELFNPSGTFSASHPNLRCFANPDQLHSIDRFVDGLLQLRGNSNHLIFAPITGIPLDLVPENGESPNWGALVSDDPSIRDDRLEERVDPAQPDRLIPSCNVPGRGTAFPPIRILRVAQRLEEEGAGVTAQSICQESFEGALTQVISLVRRALNQACLPRELNLEADGSVACEVVAVMPDGMDCGGMAGAEPRVEDGAAVFQDGRPVCVVPQVVPSDRTEGAAAPSDVGWFYDTFTPDALASCGSQRIAFTVQPPSGSTVRLECFQTVQEGGEGEVQIGTFCEPDADSLCGGGTSSGGATLSCDPVQRTCGVACGTDADCRGAGLVGFLCDRRPLGDVEPGLFPGAGESYDFCVNPTCD